MPYRLRGVDAFFEGWLARALGAPKVCIASDDIDAWLRGWESADSLEDPGQNIPTLIKGGEIIAAWLPLSEKVITVKKQRRANDN